MSELHIEIHILIFVCVRVSVCMCTHKHGILKNEKYDGTYFPVTRGS